MSPRLRSLVALAALAAGLGSAHPAGAETPTELLREYLRLDTSNPPGGEAAAAALLAGVLHREGIATRLLVSPGGRTSLYARLEGGPAADGALVLLHHMDVVPPGLGWSVDPFAAEQRDGFVWGVGAIDDKSLGVAHLLAFVDLKRSAGSLAHDVVLLAVADEEAGGVEGAAWILERHPELVADARAVLTEGGSNRVFADRTQWWGIEVAQKRPLWLEISASGRSGHGSKLDLHSAPNKLVLALARLLEMPREYRVTAEARLYFDALDRLARVEGPGWIARVERAIEEGRVEALLPPGQHNLFLDTKQITLLDSGRLVNAIPGRARALVDVRALPDAETDALLGEIRETLGRDVAVEVLLDAPRVAPSSTDSPVWRCLERVLSAEAPVVPTFIAGVTDARHFRELGIPVYGVSPFALGAEDAQGVHGADERISRDAFERGVRTMTELLAACARP